MSRPVPRATRQSLRTSMAKSARCVRGPVVVRRGSGVPGVGYAVGRDVGGAVVRNRVRRRLREAVRIRLGGEDIETTYLIIGRPGVENLSFGALVDAVSECISELESRAR